MTDEPVDPNNQTKVGATPFVDAVSIASDPNTFDNADLVSLDEIDATLNKIDPQFQNQLSKIGPNEEMRDALVDGFIIDFNADAPKETLTFKEKLVAIPRAFLVLLKESLSSRKEKMSDNLRTFKYSSGKKKISIVAMIALFIGAAFISYKAVTKGLFPHSEELFISSMKDWSQESFSFESNETEFLYESTHSSKDIMEISRMVVNIGRSRNSGDSPMAAMDFYIEGSASDVMVEVKDREAEVKDLIQRNIEDLTFDQLASGEGKQLLCEKLRKEVNKILTKGKIRRFYIKTAIVKP